MQRAAGRHGGRSGAIDESGDTLSKPSRNPDDYTVGRPTVWSVRVRLLGLLSPALPTHNALSTRISPAASIIPISFACSKAEASAR